MTSPGDPSTTSTPAAAAVESPGQAAHDWRVVDEGWGRAAVDFATLSEPANCREYVGLHQLLGVSAGDELLDVACGAGLAIELAGLRGARCAGIDASPRLVAVARDRSPEADVQVGDMHAMPWPDASFDVVTSFRGIWGTTPEAFTEVRRVLRPGGRLGLTVWGHIKASPGGWALFPLSLASAPKVDNQRAMVALGRPGVGEQVLGEHGFTDVRRQRLRFAWEFADPAAYARALLSTGPAYEAVQSIGEEAFVAAATHLAAERVREGMPLRAEIDVVAFTASAPVPPPAPPRGDHARTAAASTSDRGDHARDAREGAGFLTVPTTTAPVQAMYDEDVADHGFVMNVSRLWAQLPEVHAGLFDLIRSTAREAGLTMRQRGILVTACASAVGDSYCALAWGDRLAAEVGPEAAGAFLAGDDDGLDATDLALARWARRVTQEPNATTAADVDELRAVGFDDRQVFALTTFAALRLAFSTINDALGARPDAELMAQVPEEVRDAVVWGRGVDE